MSSYGYDDDEPRRYRNVQTRPRGRDEPDYVREETYIERGKGSGPGAGTRGSEMVFRGREDSIEDIPRDFPPPGSGAGRDRDYRRSSYRSEVDDYRRSKSAGRGYDDYYSEDDRYTDYTRSRATGGGGRRRGGRDYDSEYSNSPPPSTRSDRRDRRKSSGLLDSLGLGALAGAITGKKSSRDRSPDRSVRSGRSRSRAASRSSRRRYSSGERSRSGSRSPSGRHNTEKKWAQAAQAALIAGAVEAFRNRKEAGPWNGDKGKRVATAALGAGGIDGLLDRNPNEKTKRHLAEAVIGGLAANRLANGPRSKSRSRNISVSPDGRPPRSRSRSIIDRFRGRSQSRPRSEFGDRDRDGGGGGGGSGAIKSLAAGGALAAAGTAIYNRVRSKSRNRRSRSRASSADSYVPSRNRRRGTRRSPPSDTGTRSVADRGRSRDLGSRDINDNYNDNQNGGGALVGAGAAGGGAAALAQSGQGGGQGGSQRGGQGGSQRGGQGGSQTGGQDNNKGDNDSEKASDSSSTTDMENKRKHMRGKELLTAGLATIATIHAAHGVYSSMEAHQKRHQLVAEGEMSPQTARKKQTKAWIQDAAAVSIAALGIKGAFSEWKEMNEHRREIHNIEIRKRQRRKRQIEAERQRQRDNEERFFKAIEQNPQMAVAMPQMQEQMKQNGISMPQLPMYRMPSPQPGGDRGSRPPQDQSGGGGRGRS